MKTYQLFDNVKFSDSAPHAEPLHVDKLGRVLLYALRPGQAVREHNAPHSPVTFVVIQGRGMFAGSDEREHELGPNALVVLNPGENHAVVGVTSFHRSNRDENATPHPPTIL